MSSRGSEGRKLHSNQELLRVLAPKFQKAFFFLKINDALGRKTIQSSEEEMRLMFYRFPQSFNFTFIKRKKCNIHHSFTTHQIFSFGSKPRKNCEVSLSSWTMLHRLG